MNAYYKNSRDKLIAYKGNYKPVKVVDKISYVGESIQGSPSLEYASEYKKNLISMAIDGNTMQNGTPTTDTPIPIQNAGDNGLECVLRGKNLLNVDKFVELVKKYHVYAYETTVDGRKCIAFMNNQMHGRDFTSCCSAFKEKTRYIFSFIGRISTTNTENAQQTLSCGFKGVTSAQQTGNRVLSPLSDEWKRAYSINNANTTVTDIYISYGSSAMWLIDLDSIYLYEYEGDTDPEYEPYFNTTIQIPTTVNVGEVDIPLRFGRIGEYIDKLNIDNNSVIYTKRIEKLVLTGEEIITALDSSAFGNNSYSVYDPSGYSYNGIDINCNCTHFTYYDGNFDKPNSFVIGSEIGIFNTSFSTVEDFKAFLQMQYIDNTPVTFVYPLLDDIKDTVYQFEHDLTDTDLGKELLSFTESTQNQTNIIEIIPSNIDNPNVSNISITYAKWGGRDEV